MEIILYVCNSDKHTVNKELMMPITLNGTALRDEENNIETPVIRIVSSDQNVFRYNYAYIPDFYRYYFFKTPVTILRNGVYELNLESDPLMSFKDEFLQNNGYVEQSQNYGNFYLDDKNMPLQQNTTIPIVKQYNTPFSDRSTSVIMNVLGLDADYTLEDTST